MRTMGLVVAGAAVGFLALTTGYGCSASTDSDIITGSGGGGAGGPSGGVGGEDGPRCGGCDGLEYTPCENDVPGPPSVCESACDDEFGCVDCVPGTWVCVGNEVHACRPDGTVDPGVAEACDVGVGDVCSEGSCRQACEVAEDQPSNIGCQFYAVDMDQVDALVDPAGAPWGIAISNASPSPANVTIEMNDGNPGEPLAVVTVDNFTVDPGTLRAVVLPTREIDCGAQPNDYAAPGTCLSSRAYRITSSAPIVVYQYNVFENAFSNDASLLLPTNALGTVYRVMGWQAGHPVPFPPLLPFADRAAVTIVGTQENTSVSVRPSWRIKGNPPIAATDAGGTITVTLGPFDVLNLETDDGTFQDDPATIADLTGTLVTSDKPVAVFSGVETTSVPGPVDIPAYPGWDPDDTCCLDHLEEQLFPAEAVGNQYVITRSPIRSTGSWPEPDVLRFIAPAETTQVTTSLPPPFDTFTLEPGQVVSTWTQEDVVVEADKPVMVGQYLVSQDRIDGAKTGDPAMTVFPPVEQYRTEYIILTPGSWSANYVVLAAEVGSDVTIDGAAPTNCVVTPAGTVDGVNYESRRCPLDEGVHGLQGTQPFGVVAYGYGSAGSYAFAGGADVKPIYEVPTIR
ncbi:MAG: IgGFc-binding protein [Myxococcota bacterium]